MDNDSHPFFLNTTLIVRRPLLSLKSNGVVDCW